MSRKAFLALVGPRLVHVTAAGNLPGIQERGLLPAETLSKTAGYGGKITLRKQRLTLPCGAVLTHQRPLVEARTAAAAMLDGHTPESWAAQLDRRVFFWTARGAARFLASLRRETHAAELWIDAGRLYDACSDRIDLAPANTGNFKQGGARLRRGDWIYVPARRAECFSLNRVTRGLVRCPDRVREVSLRGALSPEALATLRLP